MNPPHNIAAEQAALAAMMIDPTVVDTVAGILKSPEMLFSVKHQHIYRAILSLSSKAQEIEWLSIREQIKSDGRLEHCGGQDALDAYLSEITQQLPSAYGYDRYAHMVRDAWMLREVIQRTSILRERAGTTGADAKAIVEALVRDAMDLSLNTATRDPMQLAHFGDIVRERAASGGVQGLQSGWSGLDAITTGWRPGQLIVVGARPGQGKSSFAAAVALQNADAGVLMFSLEMAGEEIYPRIIAMHACVDASEYMHGRLTGTDKYRANEAEIVLDSKPIWLDDSPKLSIQDVRAQARRWALQHSISLIVVDYLGLVDATDRGAQRYEQLGEVSRGLKQLARELNVPIIAPHQLSRAAEKNEPTLADLRESGNIEQDADQVVFVHRVGETAGGVTPVNLIVAKNRSGPTGKVRMNFRRACTRFEEIVQR